ncbi:MAG: nucleotide pyrophosphohydrolase [Elusimicrobia bacterium CG08_land_8_20_14_0_20_59_10]|nr:MAG: nucleotide pyrophosphohydrolase [Elusimicrobia bacterium CG08_land_8_20_14_0_20_59_10]
MTKHRLGVKGRKLAGSSSLRALVKIMDMLLSPGGCPWDRRQTHSTLLKYLREESGEVSQAVRRRDWDNLREELGDVLLQVVFHSALARRAGHFSLGDVIKTVNSKMVRRHPHVFGGSGLDTPAQVLRQWKIIKRAEKKKRRGGKRS